MAKKLTFWQKISQSATQTIGTGLSVSGINYIARQWTDDLIEKKINQQIQKVQDSCQLSLKQSWLRFRHDVIVFCLFFFCTLGVVATSRRPLLQMIIMWLLLGVMWYGIIVAVYRTIRNIIILSKQKTLWHCIKWTWQQKRAYNLNLNIKEFMRMSILHYIQLFAYDNTIPQLGQKIHSELAKFGLIKSKEAIFDHAYQQLLHMWETTLAKEWVRWFIIIVLWMTTVFGIRSLILHDILHIKIIDLLLAHF